MSQRQDYLELEHEQEYTTRTLYFQCKSSNIENHSYLNININGCTGTRKVFDELIKKAIQLDKDFTYEIIKVWDSEIDYVCATTDQGIAQYRNSNKDTKNINESKRYLKDGYR